MSAERLTRGEYAAYAALAMPLAFLGLPLYVYVPKLYAELPAIGLALAGAVLFAARLLDLVTDPAMGYLGDRLRSRVHPLIWIAMGVPVVGTGVFLLFNPPLDAGVVYLGVSVSLTYLGWTLLNVPYYAWGAEIAQESAARRRLSAWREGAVLGGALVALVVAALAPVEPMQALWLAFSLLLLIAFMALLRLPRPKVSAQQASPGPLDLWRHTGTGMRRLLVLHFLNALAAGVPATLFLMYTTDVLGLDDRGSGVLLLIYFVSGVLALPLWVRLAADFGEIRAWQVAILLAAAGFLPAAFIDASQAWIFFIVCAVTGATLGADIALPAAMQARLANADSTQAGHARESASFGLWGMAGKLALACAVGLTFPVLDALPEGEARAAALPWLYALGPVLVKTVVVLLIERWHPVLREPGQSSAGPISIGEKFDGKQKMVGDSTDSVAPERV